jgi:alkylated DNA repair dioxygenase AlkB
VLALFDHGQPRIHALNLRRIDLGQGCWVDHQSGFLSGHQALMDDLVPRVAWQQRERTMWDQQVLEPRLTAAVPGHGDHPLLHDIGQRLCAHYQGVLRQITLSLYRDGRDSVALHGDRGEARSLGSLTISVSLGAPRKLLLKPTRGPSRAFHLGWGDLFVMGGAIQRHWQHGIPKCRGAAPRMACLFWLSGRHPVVLDETAVPRRGRVGQHSGSRSRVPLGQGRADGHLVNVVGGSVGPLGQHHGVLHDLHDGISGLDHNPSN